MDLIDSLCFINTALDNIYEEHLTQVWLHKDLKKPLSLEEFIETSLKRRVSKKKVLKTASVEEELEAIEFSSQFIKTKGSD